VKQALVLLSGGLDSTTVLYAARAQGFTPQALVFRYGQRHAVEVDHAVEISRRLGVECRVQDLDLRGIGGSALTSDALDVPKGRSDAEISSARIPVTYVPARNTIFLAFALAWAEVLGIEDVFVGVNALDYSGYPDCRPEYIAAFERLAALACRSSTEGGARIRIHTPLIQKTKADIVRWAQALGVDFALTWSCYDPQPRAPTTAASPSRAPAPSAFVPCGACDSCRLRQKGFREAGVPDPTEHLIQD
jgi:7-cyano-7-deazaguanine synthase